MPRLITAGYSYFYSNVVAMGAAGRLGVFFCAFLFLFDDGVGWDVNVHHDHVTLLMLR